MSPTESLNLPIGISNYLSPLGISILDKLLLVTRIDNSGPVCERSNNWLSKTFKLSKPTLLKGLDELLTAGYITFVAGPGLAIAKRFNEDKLRTGCILEGEGLPQWLDARLRGIPEVDQAQTIPEEESAEPVSMEMPKDDSLNQFVTSNREELGLIVVSST